MPKVSVLKKTWGMIHMLLLYSLPPHPKKSNVRSSLPPRPSSQLLTCESRNQKFGQLLQILLFGGSCHHQQLCHLFELFIQS